MPQVENGYTRIADEILEKVAKTKLNGTQFRILMIVWRSTYGWQKKEHELSLGYLSKATDIHKQQIKREVDKMIKEEILIIKEESTYTKPRVIGFNKNYVNSIQATKKIPVSENADPTVNESVYPTVSENADQNKDSNKHNKYKDVFDYYLTLNLIRHKNYTKDMTDAMKKAEKDLKISTEDMKKMLKRYKEKYEKSLKTKFPLKKRPLAEFFGQAKYQSKSLICSDYLEEYYEDQPKQPIKPREVKLKFKD